MVRPDKTKFELTSEDIKMRTTIKCIRCMGALKYEFDLGHFKKQMKKYEDKWVPIYVEKVL